MARKFKFDDRDDRDEPTYKKKSKHATNRIGEGMRVINHYVEDYVDMDDDLDFDDEYELNKNSWLQSSRQLYCKRVERLSIYCVNL